MSNCNDKKKFKTAEASTKSQLRTKGIIDEFLNILKQNEFRKRNKELTDYAKSEYGVDKGMLFVIVCDDPLPVYKYVENMFSTYTGPVLALPAASTSL